MTHVVTIAQLLSILHDAQRARAEGDDEWMDRELNLLEMRLQEYAGQAAEQLG